MSKALRAGVATDAAGRCLTSESGSPSRGGDNIFGQPWPKHGDRLSRMMP